MNTEIILVKHPLDPASFRRPGQALASGRIVGFPTETVYGLGASALLPDAVREIFRLKGRPTDNPLIVHLLSAADVNQVAESIPDAFHTLYEAFSPGPLTYVMPRRPDIPDEVTAGLSTVAVRFPSQPAARALLEAAGVPVVAPSANLSGRPSPTRARHVLDDFAGRIPFLIDDGPCEVGLESTVIDLTSDPIRILRPGKITAGNIFEQTGIPVVSWQEKTDKEKNGRPSSPGTKYRHYAPRARVVIVLPGTDATIAEAFLTEIDKERASIGLFLSEETWDAIRERLTSQSCHEDWAEREKKRQVPLNLYTYEGGRDLTRAMHHLFDALRTLDMRAVDIIYAEGFDGEEATAYMDRLSKAADVSEMTGEPG
ncbi:MAG TPA: L-threonylcarbamoyladenylate synthase [Clostridia bacterium]|nr:L-threonylcarbamoyladenylate synthase [Clostridia bacterium]